MIVRKIIKWNWIQIIRLLWIIFRYLILQVSPLLAKTMQRVKVLTATSKLQLWDLGGIIIVQTRSFLSVHHCIWKSLFSRWERKIACIILFKKKCRLETWARKGVTAVGIQPILFVPLSCRTAETTFVNEAVSHMFSQNFWKPGKLDLTLNFNRI